MHAGSIVGFPERSVWPNHVIDLSCDGTEASIWDCPRNQQPGQACTSYSKDGRVTCAGVCIVVYSLKMV